MIGHYLKLVWNRKRANGLILAEILISFLVLCAVFAVVATTPATGAARSASTIATCGHSMSMFHRRRWMIMRRPRAPWASLSACWWP